MYILVNILHFHEFSKEETLRLFNRLTVRIADTMDADIPRGKQESNVVYKRGVSGVPNLFRCCA